MSDPTQKKNATPPTVIVVGAAFSGLPLAHRLIKGLPEDYHITLIDPSTHLYWNIAAPRAVVKNHSFSTSNAGCFASKVTAFSKHPSSRFTFIQGRATALDPDAHTLTITRSGDDGIPAAPEVLSYTHVVIATGASVVSESGEQWPFKQVGSHIQTQRALESLQSRIEAARSIVISGAGPTGVETAGEIATLWPKKTVTLINSGAQPLPHILPKVGKTAQKLLESQGVSVRNGARAVSENQGSVTLSDGTTIEADLHIPTHGLVPNTSFVPATLKGTTGGVLVSPQLRSSEYPNIWSLGDAAEVKYRTFMASGEMGKIVCANLLAAVNGKELKMEYKDAPTMIAVPVGGKFAKGTGIFGSWKIWGVLVWLVKGRTYFTENLQSVALGKNGPGGGKV
jgi:NADH dehydrogenase FAD-containing subunit